MAIRSKRINSRAKGCRGERAFRDVLREAGYLKARRGQQFCGSPNSPDVICEELPEIHWEVKCCEAGNPYNWISQARKDCLKLGFDPWSNMARITIKVPVVAHKRNQSEWLAILPMCDFLEIIRRSDLPKTSADALLDATGVPHNGNGKVTIP